MHCALGEVRIGTLARKGRLAIRLAVVVACADDARGRGAPRCLSSSGSVASAGALPPFFPIECGGHCALWRQGGGRWLKLTSPRVVFV